MVTMTRDLERGLIAAGMPEEEARAIVDGLEARLSELATREDLERELEEFRREMKLRFDAVDQRFEAVDQRFDAVDQRFEAVDRRIDDLSESLNKRIDDLNHSLNRRIDDLNHTMWRGFMLLATIGGAAGAAIFGALMYSIFS